MKLVPGLKKIRIFHTTADGNSRERVWGYALPELVDCRAAFERAVGQQVEWDDPANVPTEGDRE
jgi:hypothetical protein